MNLYGSKIRAEREKRNLTQTELSKLASLSLNTLSRIEQGFPSSPPTRRRLEAALESAKVSAFYQEPQQLAECN